MPGRRTPVTRPAARALRRGWRAAPPAPAWCVAAWRNAGSACCTAATGRLPGRRGLRLPVVCSCWRNSNSGRSGWATALAALMRQTPVRKSCWSRPIGCCPCCWRLAAASSRLQPGGCCWHAGWPERMRPDLLLCARARPRHKRSSRGLRNLRGAFCARAAARAVGRRVLLVDDVMTTGATLHAAARPARGWRGACRRPGAGAHAVTTAAPARQRPTVTIAPCFTSTLVEPGNPAQHGQRDPPGGQYRLHAAPGGAAGISMEDRLMRRAGLDYPHEYASCACNIGLARCAAATWRACSPWTTHGTRLVHARHGLFCPATGSCLAPNRAACRPSCARELCARATPAPAHAGRAAQPESVQRRAVTCSRPGGRTAFSAAGLRNQNNVQPVANAPLLHIARTARAGRRTPTAPGRQLHIVLRVTRR